MIILFLVTILLPNKLAVLIYFKQAWTSLVASANLSFHVRDVFLHRTNVEIQVSLWLDLTI